MNKNDRINIGDNINIFFEHLDPIFDCEVLYTPQATGDSWHFKNLRNGQITYVQQFSRMDKMDKDDECIENENLKKEISLVQVKYNELIMSVGNKYKDETRHETALRYIRQTERGSYRPMNNA